jgi:hypothetical protein
MPKRGQAKNARMASRRPTFAQTNHVIKAGNPMVVASAVASEIR